MCKREPPNYAHPPGPGFHPSIRPSVLFLEAASYGFEGGFDGLLFLSAYELKLVNGKNPALQDEKDSFLIRWIVAPLPG